MSKRSAVSRYDACFARKIIRSLGRGRSVAAVCAGTEVASTVGRPRNRGRGAADGAEGPAYTAALGHRELSTTHVGGLAPANSTSERGG